MTAFLLKIFCDLSETENPKFQTRLRLSPDYGSSFSCGREVSVKASASSSDRKAWLKLSLAALNLFQAPLTDSGASRGRASSKRVRSLASVAIFLKLPVLHGVKDLMIKHILLLAAVLGFIAQSSVFAAEPSPSPSEAPTAPHHGHGHHHHATPTPTPS